jgi:primosomal protein N' (replication factor Y)
MYCADVLPNPGKPFDQVFTYEVPRELASRIGVGCQVVVPLGARAVPGFVVRLHTDTEPRGLKAIQGILKDALALPLPLIQLAQWMSEYYLCPLGEALQPVLPPGSPRLLRQVRLTAPADSEEARRLARESPECASAIGLLREGGGVASVRRLEKEAGAEALRRLRSAGVVEVDARVVARRPLTATMVQLVLPAREVREAVGALRKRAPKQAAVLEALLAVGGPVEIKRLAKRAQTTTEVVRSVAERGLARLSLSSLRRVPWDEAERILDSDVGLTADQAEAVSKVAAAIEAGRPRTFLLYGVTASGKTEVFLRAARRALELGRQAIILMPEISLTAQAVGIFRGRFGDGVAVLHSALSPGERFDEWRRIHAGEAQLIIGARSALFAPCPRLGLIVVDEEHDPSYKQDSPPRYHARDTAIERARREDAVVLLAGATPSIESFHRAQQGEYEMVRLRGRIGDRPPPQIEIVDRRGLRRSAAARRARRAALPELYGRSASAANRESAFTPRLVYEMKRAMDAGEQIILFLNRRGYATVVLCPECGEALRCPHCNVALVFHRAGRAVACHHCGLSDAPPTTCGNCGGANVRFAGFGTERVEEELRRLLPQARPTRMDRDTTAGKGAHVRIVDDFRNAEADVLVGTQMVTKGFHFPGVTLVGVLCADVALNLPDFRAGERAFQLLAQVSGRCGRGDKPGRVIIQTYAPEHYAIAAAQNLDYEAFFAQEIAARREHGYPPFSHLCNVVVSAESEKRAREYAEALALGCAESGAEGVEVMGPATAPLARLRGRSRWHLLLKSADAGGIRQALRRGLEQARPARDVNVLIDMDPESLT